MNSKVSKKQTTYRLTKELDDIITEQARRLGISKNAFVQKTLTEVLLLNNASLSQTDIES